jgi:hypothetical protein
MLSHTPSWLPKLTDADIPDDISLTEFVFHDGFRPFKCNESPQPFLDSIDGLGFSVHETRQRVEWLAAGLAAHLNLDVNSENVFDKVVNIFAVNNVSTRTFTSQMALH